MQAHLHAVAAGDAQQDLSAADILDALKTYSLGYSLEQTRARVKQKTGRAIGHSTLSNWLAEHRALMSYRRLRGHGRHRFPPEQTIRSIKLYHRQVYGYGSCSLRLRRAHTLPNACPHGGGAASNAMNFGKKISP